MQLNELFPDEDTAVKWFEAIYWPEKRCCGHCGSINTVKAKHRTMPYFCNDCRSYFSVRTGTTLQNSRLPLRKWAFAVYLYVTHLKGVSSMKLHRDLQVTQKTAWFMLHRLREAWNESGLGRVLGPAEVDETWVGGQRRTMHATERAKFKKWTRGSNMVPVVGMVDRKTGKVRAQPVDKVRSETLIKFIRKNSVPWATIYTDGAVVYSRINQPHEHVNHMAGEYVRGDVHTNSIESFWSMLKRAHKGTYHKMSPKHLGRYINEFSGRHNVRDSDTEDQMQNVAAGMIGKRLLYRDLIA